MPRRLLPLFMLSLSLVAQTPEPRGDVTVKVVDRQGNPVSSATVRLDPVQEGIRLGVLPECRTDASGVCSTRGLSMGTYLLGAMKPSDGYPNLTPEFYSHENKRVRLILSHDNLHANIVFTLGPQMAKLKLSFVDDQSGVPIESNPSVILRGSADSHDWVSIGKTSDSTFLVPPDKDVHLEVDAAGFQSWRSEEHPEQIPTGVLHLHSNDSQEIEIRLKPR